jgi:hypothetical protein
MEQASGQRKIADSFSAGAKFGRDLHFSEKFSEFSKSLSTIF